MLTQQQLELRRTGITATDIGAIAGVSPYAGPIDVWLAKRNELAPASGHHIERGTYLEPSIIRWTRKRYGWRVLRASTTVHPDDPLVIATPDGLVAHGRRKRGAGSDVSAILEIKCPGRHTAHQWGEPETDQVPAHYMTQVTWAMAVAQVDTAYVVALIDGDIQRYPVAFNARLYASLRAVAGEFWHRHVLTGQAPAPDGSASYRQYLDGLPPSSGVELATDESDDLMQLIDTYRYAHGVSKAAAAGLEKSKQQLMAYIGERPGVRGSYGSVRYANNKDSIRTDWAAVAKEVDVPAETVVKHTTTKPGPRVFRATLKDLK